MLLRKFLKVTAVGRLVMIPVRLDKIALSCALRQLGLMVRWTFTSKEYYNHSYHLTDLNKHYLASYISVVSGHDLATIEKYIAELEGDEKLRATLEQRTRASRDRHNCDVEPRLRPTPGLVRAGAVHQAARVRRNSH